VPVVVLGLPGLTQLVPETASSSALARSMPESITATAVVAGVWASVGVAPPLRRTPGGTVSPAASACMPVALTSTSGSTATTAGSASTRSSWGSLRSVAKPVSAAS
jgi:hypothetical protein